MSQNLKSKPSPYYSGTATSQTNGDTVMPMAMQKIETEALNLDIHSRASLVGKLLLSLDEPTVSEVKQLWLDEAERRLDDYRAGKVQGIPGNEVFKRAIAELS
jgi:putative addiction module component (TIGR02574 family)